MSSSVMVFHDSLSLRWRPEYWTPFGRLLAALVCSLLIHIFLILISGGTGSMGRATALPEAIFSSANRIQSAFLEVTLLGAGGDQPAVVAENRDSAVKLADTPFIAAWNEQKEHRRPGEQGESGGRSAASNQARMQDGVSATPATDSAAQEEKERTARQASYALASLLDVPPVPLNAIQPDYPASGRNQQGKVVLRLFINENGEVDELAVARATPPGFFEAAAEAAFAPARFSPGMRFGRAVKSQLTVEVDFVPFNRGAAVSGGGY